MRGERVAAPARTAQAPALGTLSAYGNGCGDGGAAALASLLSSDGFALTALDLSANRIGDPGVAALAAGLQQNRSLVVLELGHVADPTKRHFIERLLELNTSTRDCPSPLGAVKRP